MNRLFFATTMFALFLCYGHEAWPFQPVDGPLLSDKVVFSENNSPRFMELIKGFVDAINRNPAGKCLLAIIKERISKVAAIDYLVIEESTGSNQHTAFHHGLNFEQDKDIPSDLKGAIDGKLHLYVNLNDAVSCYIPSEKCESLFSDAECLYGPKLEVDRLAYYRVANMHSPFYVTIAHEFIHLKHFLDDCLGISKMPCGHAALIREYCDVKKYPELEGVPELAELNVFSGHHKERTLNRLRRVIPWENFEERRTVCGPDIDGITEMTFRLAEGLPIRYIYQGCDHYFLEEASVAEKIIELNLGYCVRFHLEMSMEGVLQGLPIGLHGFLDREERAKKNGLSYCSLAVKLGLLSDAEIIAGISQSSRSADKNYIETALRSLRSPKE